MASVYHLLADSINVEESIVHKYKDNENESKKKFFSAVTIQKVYRGYITRKTVKNQMAAIVTIQRNVIKWLMKYHLPDILHEYWDELCYNHYNDAASKIQALWKGYLVRKEICIEDIMRRRAEVLAANEKVNEVLTQIAQKKDIMSYAPIIKKILEALFDRHHLLRTHQTEGLFSKANSRELSELEKIIKSIKWTDYMKKLRKTYNNYYEKEDKYNYKFEDKQLRRLEDLYRQRDKSQDTRVVVEDDLTGYIQEKGFDLNTTLKKKPYERLSLTTEKYVPPITEILRTEDSSKNICREDFKLYVWKKLAHEADVPPYYVDFWYYQCNIHNIPDM